MAMDLNDHLRNGTLEEKLKNVKPYLPHPDEHPPPLDGEPAYNELVQYANTGQYGCADLFARIMRGRFVYDHTEGSWYAFKAARHWVRDDTLRAHSAIEEIIDRLKRAADEAHNQSVELTDKNEKKRAEADRKSLMRAVRHLRTERHTNEVLKLATYNTRGLAVTSDIWDCTRGKLPLYHGVVDLSDGTLRQGRPDDYITKVCPTPFIPLDIQAPLWERTLSQIFNDDQDLIAYFHRLMGYAILGESNQAIFAILHGRGRNGKSLILEVLKSVLGPLASPVNGEMLLQQAHSKAGSPDPDTLKLKGRRLVWASETERNRRISESRMKVLTGGDTLTARPLYGKQDIEFEPTHFLMILTNYLPHADAHDFAFWKRAVCIPFNVSFVADPKEPNEKQADPELVDKLKDESSGILSWLIRGCLDYQAHGLTPPACVKAATDEYRHDNDSVGQFLDDCCVVASTARVKAGELYWEYQTWCDSQGRWAMNQTNFGKIIKEKYPPENKNAKPLKYQGVGLKYDR